MFEVVAAFLAMGLGKDHRQPTTALARSQAKILDATKLSCKLNVAANQ
jgi:hypothetical protein